MIGATLRQYRIAGILGKGGMGEVYAASDTKLNRRVALKLLPQDMVADAVRLHRFAREAQAIAALNHPNVVTIYGVDEADGVHFIAMELVEGRPLADVIPSGGFALGAFLDLAIPLADAIGAAHERGVIHRDLKPANIMITNDRRLKVLDFGLAKLREDVTNTSETTATLAGKLTADQHIIGTAAYMSPEQAQAEHIDHRTDIFSLGIVLYEMATGRRPFSGTTPISMISSIVKDTPSSIAEVKPSMPPDLDRIIRRCLMKDPARRYQSAIDVRNELEDLRSTKAPARRRFPTAWLAVAVGAALIGIAIWRWPLPPRGDASPKVTFAQLTGDPGAELYPSISPDGKWIVYTGELEGNRDIFLQSVNGEKPINLTKDSPDDDEEPAFSPDGERIAFRSSRGGGGIFVMGRTGEAVKRITTSGFNPSFSPDGSQIVYASERIEVNPQNSQGVSTLWTVNANGGTPKQLNSGPDATQPKFSPHNKRIAYMARLVAGQVDVWTMSLDGKSRVAVTGDLPTDWSPFWSPDGKFLYFCSDRGGSMNLWRVPIDEESGRTRGAPQPVTTPAPFVAHPSISGDGKRIAYSSVVRSANIQTLTLDPVAGRVIGEPSWVTTGSRSWSSPDPSPDGQWVAFYSIIQPEGHLYVVRSNGTELRQLTSDSAIDRMPRWSPDGQWLAFFSNRSGPLEIWKMRPDGADLQRLTALGSTAYPIWARDGATMFAEHTGGKVFRLDANRTFDRQQAEVIAERDPAHAMLPNSLTSDGRRLATQLGPVSLGIGVFDVAAKKLEMLTSFGEWPVWTPDDRHILFVHRGKEFWLADSVTKETRKIFSVTRDVVGPPRLTRDGRHAFYSRRVTEADVWIATLSDTADTSRAAR